MPLPGISKKPQYLGAQFFLCFAILSFSQGKVEHIIDSRTIREFLNGLDEQELMALEVAALPGDSFRLDDLIELNSIKSSKLLALLRKMAQKNVK